MPLADEKKVRSFTACDDVYAWWPDSGSGAERQWTTLSQLVWQDMDLTRPKCCILDRFWTFSTSCWENIVDAADLSQSTCCRQGQHQCGKASSQGEYSESSTHAQAVLSTVGLAESTCGYDCEQLLLALDHSEELFPKFRTPTSLMVQVKNKTQNWAILWHWLFWYQSVWLGMTSFSWKWCGWLCLKKTAWILYNNTGIRNSRKQVFLASEKRYFQNLPGLTAPPRPPAAFGEPPQNLTAYAPALKVRFFPTRRQSCLQQNSNWTTWVPGISVYDSFYISFFFFFF